MQNKVFNQTEEQQIFKSIGLVNDLMYNKGFRYCPFFFKDKIKNEYSLRIMKMDFLNVKNEEVPIGSFVKNNKSDMNVVMKSLARFINNETVNNFDITSPKEDLLTREQTIKLIDSILDY